jgi:hypothetical protein
LDREWQAHEAQIRWGLVLDRPAAILPVGHGSCAPSGLARAWLATNQCSVAAEPAPLVAQHIIFKDDVEVAVAKGIQPFSIKTALLNSGLEDTRIYICAQKPTDLALENAPRLIIGPAPAPRLSMTVSGPVCSRTQA